MQVRPKCALLGPRETQLVLPFPWAEPAKRCPGRTCILVTHPGQEGGSKLVIRGILPACFGHLLPSYGGRRVVYPRQSFCREHGWVADITAGRCFPLVGPHTLLDPGGEDGRVPGSLSHLLCFLAQLFWRWPSRVTGASSTWCSANAFLQQGCLKARHQLGVTRGKDICSLQKRVWSLGQEWEGEGKSPLEGVSALELAVPGVAAIAAASLGAVTRIHCTLFPCTH